MRKMRKKNVTVAPGRPSPSGARKLSRALADLAFEHKLDKAIGSIQDSYLSTDTLSIEGLSYKVLQEAKRLTGSAFGFAGYIDPATGWFVAATHTREIWDKCRIRDKAVIFKRFTGLWGWVLKNKKPLLTNAARADRRAGGVPKGHIRVEKFLAAPAVFNRKLAGMLALANPAADYSARDLSAVQRLAHVYAIILQRKFAEDRLRAGDEKLRSVVDNTRDIIYSMNPHGALTYVSRQVTRYGYDPEKLVGRHFLEFAHPGDRPRLLQALAEAMKTGKTAPLLAYRIRKQDGSYFFAEQKSGIIMKNGRPQSVSGVIRDVTDSRRLEKQILESEKKYRTLFDRAVDGIVMMPVGGKELIVNDSFAEMHGYSGPKEMAHLRLQDLDTPETARLAPERLRRLAAGEDMSFGVEHYRKDGSIFPLYVSCKVVEIDRQKYFLGFHRDMTAAKRATEALGASERMYRLLAESIPDYIYLLDPKGRLLYSNRPLPGMPKNVAGKAQHELFPPETAKKHLEVIARVARTGESSLRYESVPWTDGRTVWFENRLVPLKDPAGRVTRLLGITRDITEYKKMSEDLRTGERKFRALFDHTSEFIGMLTPDGRLMEANQTALEFAGIEREDCVGKYFWDTAWWRHSAEMRKRLRHAVAEAAKGGTVRFEATHPASDGSLHYVEFSLKPVSDADGRVLFLIPEGRDITERRRLVEELRESRERFKGLVETTSDWVWETDPNGVYTYASPQVERILGYKPEELIGKTPFVLMPPKEAKRIRKLFVQHAAAEKVFSGLENLNLHKTGRGVVLETNGAPFYGPDGKFLGYRGIDRDITERRKMEEALIHAKAVARAGKITGDAAHDFNNILSTITGYAAMILDELNDKNPIRPDILEIIKAVRRATTLTEKLQAIGKDPDKKA